MSRTQKWSEIRDQKPRTATSEALLRDERQRLELLLSLSEARKARKLTQTQLAKTMGISQSNVSQIENGSDPQLATIARYIEALGGRLELRAVFDDGQVVPLIPATPPLKPGKAIDIDELERTAVEVARLTEEFSTMVRHVRTGSTSVIASTSASGPQWSKKTTGKTMGMVTGTPKRRAKSPGAPKR